MAQQYVNTPARRDVPVAGGKVEGTVQVSFVRADRVQVCTNLGRETVTYRGDEYRMRVDLTRVGEAWQVGDYAGVTRNMKPAPPSYRETIIAAAIETVAGVWTPAIAREASYAHAAQRLYTLDRERAAAAERLAAVDAERAPYLAIVEAGNPAEQ